jgi:hypothetical protein
VEVTIWALLGQQQGRTTTSGVYSSKSRSWSWRLRTSRNFQPRKVWQLSNVRSLQQKIQILKLNIIYLKKLPAKDGKNKVIYQKYIKTLELENASLHISKLLAKVGQ